MTTHKRLWAAVYALITLTLSLAIARWPGQPPSLAAPARQGQLQSARPADSTETPTPTVTPTPTSMPGPPYLLSPEEGAVMPQPLPPGGWRFTWSAREGPCYSSVTISGPGGRWLSSGAVYPPYSYTYTSAEPIPADALAPWEWWVAVSCPMGSSVSPRRAFSVLPASTAPPPTPTATATCDTYKVSLDLLGNTDAVRVGEPVTVTARLVNEGCGSIGLPSYTFDWQSDTPGIFDRTPPLTVDHSTTVGVGASDQASIVLRTQRPGRARFTARVAFRYRVGMAYWGQANARSLDLAVMSMPLALPWCAGDPRVLFTPSVTAGDGRAEHSPLSPIRPPAPTSRRIGVKSWRVHPGGCLSCQRPW